MAPCVSLLLPTTPTLKQNPEWQTPLHKHPIGITWADKPQEHPELSISYSNYRWLFSGWNNYRTEAALRKVLGILWQPGLQIQTYIPSRAQEDVTKLCIYFCHLYLSRFIFLSPPNPIFPIQPSHIPHATLAVLAGHLSIPWLTFLFRQHKLTDAVPSWHSIFHFISTQKPSSTSVHLPFPWTLLIPSTQTEISSVGWSMTL